MFTRNRVKAGVMLVFGLTVMTENCRLLVNNQLFPYREGIHLLPLPRILH